MIIKTGNWVPTETIMNMEKLKIKAGIYGSLKSGPEEAVRQYIGKCVLGNPRDLLWGLIDITSRSRGKLRSQEGDPHRTSPQVSIVNLLNQDETPQRYTHGIHHLTTPVDSDEHGMFLKFCERIGVVLSLILFPFRNERSRLS